VKGKITSLIAILLLILLASPVLAVASGVPEVSVCSAYWDDGTLYTFAKFSHEDPVSLEASLLVNNAKIQEVHPQTIQDANATVHYILLIDASPSMTQFRSRITSLTWEIMEAQQNVRVSVMQFGSSCSLVAADMSEWREIAAALNSISYNKDASNITGCTAQAMELLGKDGYIDGAEMTNLVVITDGEPWYSNDSQEEQQMEQQANVYVQRMIAAYPEIVIHTFSFGQWNVQAQEALRDVRGLHEVGDEATAFGKKLAEYADSIYCVPFNLSGYDDNAVLPDEILLSVGRSLVSYGKVRNTNIPPVVEMPSLQNDPTEEEPGNTTEASSVSPEEPTTEGTTGPVDEPIDPTETDTPETTTDPAATDGTGSSEAEASTGPTNGVSNDSLTKRFSVWYIVVPVSCLVLLFLSVLFWKKRIPKGAIRMRIVQIAGRKIVLQNVYYLDRELLIGSGKQCDIVIPGSNRRGVNARIFKQNQIIYIEDMGMSEDVLLNGMQIFSSNRLRSDDEITIGAITLKVLF